MSPRHAPGNMLVTFANEELQFSSPGFKAAFGKTLSTHTRATSIPATLRSTVWGLFRASMQSACLL